MANDMPRILIILRLFGSWFAYPWVAGAVDAMVGRAVDSMTRENEIMGR